MKTEKFSIRSRSESFRFAFNGLGSLLKSEHNARIHLVASFVAVIAGIILRITLTEWCVIIIVIGMVFLTELFNSSLGALSDAVDTDWNERVKKAKDYAAGAVLVSAVVSLIVGAIIYIPRLISLL